MTSVEDSRTPVDEIFRRITWKFGTVVVTKYFNFTFNFDFRPANVHGPLLICRPHAGRLIKCAFPGERQTRNPQLTSIALMSANYPPLSNMPGQTKPPTETALSLLIVYTSQCCWRMYWNVGYRSVLAKVLVLHATTRPVGSRFNFCVIVTVVEYFTGTRTVRMNCLARFCACHSRAFMNCYHGFLVRNLRAFSDNTLLTNF
jgi:hypothetical protein